MSASGRRKAQAALGLAPPVADIFSRSTPPPWQVEKLTKALKKSKKKKKKSKCDADAPFPGDSVVEAKSQPIVHKDIDAFIKSVEGLAKDIWELDLLKKKKAVLDKMDQTAKKNGSKKPEKSVEEPEKVEKEPEPEKEPEKETSEKEKSNERVRKPISKLVSKPDSIIRKKPVRPKLGESEE
jgi:hypothetical protein